MTDPSTQTGNRIGTGAARPSRLRIILRDPLLHFLVLGGIIFLAAAAVGSDMDNRDTIIDVSAQRQAQLRDVFRATWQRSPSAQEIAGLIEEYIRDEIYYREALALGLDRNDTIVRRRLRQKLEFLHEDLEAVAEPSEAELRSYYDRNIEDFRNDARYSFRQVLIPASSGKLAADADPDGSFLRRLRASETAAALSASKLLPHTMQLATERAVSGVFGAAFAARLAQLSDGKDWQGPILSDFGAHYLSVGYRAQASALPFEDVRDQVRVRLLDERRRDAAAAFYDRLRAQYEISIASQPAAATVQQDSARGDE